MSYARVLAYFCLMKCVTFFQSETIVASFLHSMVLFPKVLLNHSWKRQFVVLHCHISIRIFFKNKNAFGALTKIRTLKFSKSVKWLYTLENYPKIDFFYFIIWNFFYYCIILNFSVLSLRNFKLSRRKLVRLYPLKTI